jgi:uncharacterized membrane protein YdfJ with MMPL/SSD domain
MQDNRLNWPGLYLAVTFAGAALGLLVALGVLPEIPDQLTGWLRTVNRIVGVSVLLLGGAAVGFVLAAVAHLGVRWQLRRHAAGDSADE